MQIISLVLIGIFQTDWFQIPFLEEARISFRLGIKSWSAGMGISIGDSHLGPVVSF